MIATARARVLTLIRHGPLRAIGVLVSGTALGHGVTALTMPIATRLFTPADFAAAAAFSSLVGILVVATCLRYEVAIPLPDDSVEAANLLGLSLAATVIASVMAGLLIAFLPASAWSVLNQPALLPYLWLLPVALLIGGVYQALQMWFVRVKGFGAIARSRFIQSAAAAGGQLSLGAAGLAPLGLLVGQVLNYGAGAFALGLGVILRHRTALTAISLTGMRRAARIHHRFPRYSVWEALANAAGIHLPVLLIAALATGPEAGYLTLAIFLLQAPMALVGNAVGQVYLSGAPEAHREGRLRSYTMRMALGLFRTAVVPLALVAVLSPLLFERVFGDGWGRAGVLVAWMAPWFLLQFVASPISMALHVVGAQRTAMMLQLTGLLLRCGAVLIASSLQPRIVSEIYSISGLVFYSIYFAVIIRVTGNRLDDASLVQRSDAASGVEPK